MFERGLQFIDNSNFFLNLPDIFYKIHFLKTWKDYLLAELRLKKIQIRQSFQVIKYLMDIILKVTIMVKKDKLYNLEANP